MIQDIYPKHLNNQYNGNTTPSDNDIICVFRGDDILSRADDTTVDLPKRSQMKDAIARETYLFSIDDTAWYLAELKQEAALPTGYEFENVRGHRKLGPRDMIYGEMTARHLYIWYRDNRFCGRCGHETVHDKKMRMKFCPECKNQIFPKICPAIIAAVVDGDKILLTRYAGRAYKHYALIAGFTEIGETAEETVAREVFEEAGIRVKNIRYWATQPWGIDSDLLIGYFCEPDGDTTIALDEEELSSAGWYSRDEIDFEPDDVSLTHNMIRAFLEGRLPD